MKAVELLNIFRNIPNMITNNGHTNEKKQTDLPAPALFCTILTDSMLNIFMDVLRCTFLHISKYLESFTSSLL